MSFNINRLKKKKEDLDPIYFKKFRKILNSEKFENKLQKYLEKEIERGYSVGSLIFSVNMISKSEVILNLKSKDSSLFVEICHDSCDKIGDINDYLRFIENRLIELKLNWSHGSIFYFPDWNDVIRTEREFEFFIKLDFRYY